MPTYSAEFQELLASANAARHFLVEVTAYSRDSESTTTLRFGTSDYTTRSDDTPANTYYQGGLLVPGVFARSLFDGNSLGGQVLPDSGYLEFDNADGSFDYLRRYNVDGRAVRILMGGDDPETATTPRRPWDYTRFQEIFQGTAEGFLPGLDRVTMRLRDLRYVFDRPLQASVYGGFGACVSLNGSSDNVSFGNIHNWGATSSWSTEFRFRMAPSLWRSHVIVGKKSAENATGAGWVAWISNSSATTFKQVRFDLADGTTLASAYGPTATIVDDEWHHAALVVDRTRQTATVYVDGVAGTAVSVSSIGSLSNAVTMYAGRNGGGTTYGQLEFDDFRIWNTARTADQIRGNRGRPLSGSESGLVDYWKFDTGTGTTDTSIGSTASVATLSGSGLWATTHEGFADLTGKPKPITFGPASNVEGVLVDPQRYVYQFNAGRLAGISTVYFGGVAKTGGGTDYTADVANLRRGCITLTSAPAARVTATITGDAHGGYITTAADIMRRVATGYRPLTGDCLEFDGWATSVSFGDNFDQTGTFTVEFWVFPVNVGQASKRIIAKDDATNGWGVTIGNDDGAAGRISFYTRGLSSVTLSTSANTLRSGRWQHVACVYDAGAGTKTIYLDGTSVATASSLTGSLTVNAANLVLGTGGTHVLSGRLDDVRIWSTARTGAQILANKDIELTGTESGLVAYWKLNDGSGSTAADTTGGVDGTVTSGTWVTSADSSLSVDTTAFSTLKSANSSAVAHHWREASTTKLDALSDVASSVGAYFTFDRSGALTCGRLNRPFTPKLGSGALYFSGGYLAIPHASGLGGGVSWHCEAWIRPERVDGRRLIARKKSSGGYGFEFCVSDGVLTLDVYNSSGVALGTAPGTTAIVPGEWVHVAAGAYDSSGNNLHIYLNGVEELDLVYQATIFGYGGASATADLQFGGDSSGAYPFIGTMDDLRWWNVGARTAANVAATYADEIQSPTTYPIEASASAAGNTQLKGYWKLNQSSGTTATDEIGTSNGTLTGSVEWVTEPRFVIDQGAILSLSPIAVDVPTYRQTVGYDPVFRVQSEDDLASGASSTWRAYVGQERRFAHFEDPSVQTAHTLARAGDPVHASFSTLAAAASEAERLQGIFGADLEMYEIQVKGLGFQADLADLATLRYNRLGMDEGVPVRIIAASDDPINGTTTLVVMR